jgi:hypothetical protein
MITQAMKKWLQKLFAWWPWRKSPQIEYSHVVNTLNRSAIEGVASQSQPGITPRISTMQEWPERTVQPLFPEAHQRLDTPLLPPSTPPGQQESKFSSTSVSDDADVVPPIPTSEQHLEFLSYLYKRGLVNEGFEEDKIPDQYRRD